MTTDTLPRAELDDFEAGFFEALIFGETAYGLYWQDLAEADPATWDAMLQDAGGSMPADGDDAEFFPESRANVVDFCATFRAAAAAELAAAYDTGYDAVQAGRDLYFTSAGHGVGYWDRADLKAIFKGDVSIGDALTRVTPRHEWSVGVLTVDPDGTTGVLTLD